jgi:ribosomal-protein-alanine N-acetyltransferase
MSEWVIRTPRLGLRPFQPKDADAFYQMNLDEEVLRYTGDAAFGSVDEARKFIEHYDAYQKWGFGRWAVVEKVNCTFIGFCGFKLNEEKEVDLGFRITRSKWNQGFASEAAEACLSYGFLKLGLKEVIGRADRCNLASIRVLEKIGMKYWKSGYAKGIKNAVYYRITIDNYST